MGVGNPTLFYVLQVENPTNMQYLSRQLHVAMFGHLYEEVKVMWATSSVHIIHTQLQSLTPGCLLALLLNSRSQC